MYSIFTILEINIWVSRFTGFIMLCLSQIRCHMTFILILSVFKIVFLTPLFLGGQAQRHNLET